MWDHILIWCKLMTIHSFQS